jgi:hypothetical protein
MRFDAGDPALHLDIVLELRPVVETIFPRDHKLCVCQCQRAREDSLKILVFPPRMVAAIRAAAERLAARCDRRNSWALSLSCAISGRDGNERVGMNAPFARARFQVRPERSIVRLCNGSWASRCPFSLTIAVPPFGGRFDVLAGFRYLVKPPVTVVRESR